MNTYLDLLLLVIIAVSNILLTKKIGWKVTKNPTLNKVVKVSYEITTGIAAAFIFADMVWNI